MLRKRFNKTSAVLIRLFNLPFNIHTYSFTINCNEYNNNNNIKHYVIILRAWKLSKVMQEYPNTRSLKPKNYRTHVERRCISLPPCAGNWFADHNEWPNRTPRSINNSSLSSINTSSIMTSLNRNLLFVSPGLYLNILKTEETLQFSDKRFSTCLSSARG